MATKSAKTMKVGLLRDEWWPYYKIVSAAEDGMNYDADATVEIPEDLLVRYLDADAAFRQAQKALDELFKAEREH